jgi:hypothetical protein
MDMNKHKLIRTVLPDEGDMRVCGLMKRIDGVEWIRVGWKYAESDVITCVGPTAYWIKLKPERKCCPEANAWAGRYAIFATHAVYQKRVTITDR